MSRSLCAVEIFADTDMMHSAYLNCGLLELAARGEIEAEFRLRGRSFSGPRAPFTVWLQVYGPDRPDPVRVCCDFHDWSAHFCPSSLKHCDIYFKSNFSHAGLSVVPEGQREKVRPFGPYFPCRPKKDSSLLLRAVGNSLTHLRDRVRSRKRSTLGVLRDILWQLRRLQQYRHRETFDAYERPPDGTVPSSDSVMFFNPSCWAEITPRQVELNDFRAELILGLRKRLGPRFVGGFRRSELAERKYPAAVEERHYSHGEYVHLLRQSPIVVYTNGVLECFSWRLLENFAAGKGMVSEPIPNDACFPLDEQHGVVQLPTSAEVVTAACELVESPERAAQLGRNAWETYLQHLRPAVKARRVLECATALGGIPPAPVEPTGDIPSVPTKCR